MKRQVLALWVALSLFFTTPAHALLEACTVTTSSLAFGNYNPFSSSATDNSGVVTVTCTAIVSIAVNYTIKLGSGNAGGYAPRKLTFGSSSLNYNLYTTSARTSIWGDGSGSTQTVGDGYALGLLLVTRNYNVYGRLFAQQNAKPGVYADNVVVTVDY